MDHKEQYNRVALTLGRFPRTGVPSGQWIGEFRRARQLLGYGTLPLSEAECAYKEGLSGKEAALASCIVLGGIGGNHGNS